MHPTFSIRKFEPIALWSYDVDTDVCAICKNNLMDPCIECQAAPTRNERDCPVAIGSCKVRAPFFFETEV